MSGSCLGFRGGNRVAESPSQNWVEEQKPILHSDDITAVCDVVGGAPRVWCHSPVWAGVWRGKWGQTASCKHGSPQFTLKRASKDECRGGWEVLCPMCCRVLKGQRFDPYQLPTPDEAQQEKTVVGMGSTNRMRARRRKEGLDRGAGDRRKRQ